MEQQRRQIGGFGEAFDAADEDGVIARRVLRFVGDFECRTAGRKDRGAAGAGLPGQPDEAVGWPSGEAV